MERTGVKEPPYPEFRRALPFLLPVPLPAIGPRLTNHHHPDSTHFLLLANHLLLFLPLILPLFLPLILPLILLLILLLILHFHQHLLQVLSLLTPIAGVSNGGRVVGGGYPCYWRAL